MSITDLMGLKSENFSFEGKLTSVILSDSGGTLTGKGDATEVGKEDDEVLFLLG